MTFPKTSFSTSKPLKQQENIMSYNVTEDRRDWARVKTDLMPLADRQFLMEELIRRDEKHAARVMGSLVSEQHGSRRSARARGA